MDLTREETTGTLVVLGLPVMTGLYAQTGEQRAAWLMRVPAWLRWACTVTWHLTWTPPQEERDAIGRAIARGARHRPRPITCAACCARWRHATSRPT